ncbi:MAG TPA: dihydrolipoamide acetyltransferase family protein [Planctomycetota bacterium]|nr:dihydrolipoamide acetyltransferase family protein [Planctomycetota bacterium]
MVTRVIMPRLAANVQEATVGQWLKHEGEAVTAGEPLFEAITDKATAEVKAEGSGVLRRILAKENSVVPVGQAIALIADADEPLPDTETLRAAAGPAEPSAVKASFGARRLAKELSVDLAALVPSRADGRITEDDVRRAAAKAQGARVLERLALSPLKRAVAAHLTRIARQVVPSVVTLEADFSAVERALPHLVARLGRPVLARDVVIHQVARLLPQHRLLNACFSDDAVLLYEPVNIGLAFDVEQESTVVVPVIHEADRKSLAEVSAEAAALAEHVRERHLELAELGGATFTIADQGALDIDAFVPILNERQSAILGVGSARRRPVLRAEGVAVAPVAHLAVAFDHRVLNATTASRFLHAVRDAIEGFRATAAP